MDPRPDDAATTPEPVAPPPQGRGRWIVAGFVVVAAIAGTIAAFLILGTKPLPEAYRYLPADSAVVLEFRPELPGDQRQHLGNFLARFPGFADQSSFSDKIDQVLARLVGQATDGQVDYWTQIKPLLAGPLVAGVSADAIAHMADGGTAAFGLLVATTDGSATCEGVFGASTASEMHREVALRSVLHDVSCAVDGRFLLLGDAAGVKAGIDAQRDHTGLDGSSRFRSARETLIGDQVALAYVDGAGLVGTLKELVPVGTAADGLTSMAPDWLVVGLRVEDDALQLEVRSPPMPAAAMASGVPTAAPAATSAFAAMIPADALGFIEAHGAGASIQRAIARLEAEPGLAGTIEQLTGALTAVGGVTNVVGWIEDIGIAAIPTGDSVGAVVLIRGTDAAATAGRLAQVRNLLILGSTGTDITLRDIDHDGVTITNVDIGDLDSLLGELGLEPGSLDLGPTARLSFSLAARDDILLVGIGEGVVERILDTSEAASIGTTPAYRRVVELAGRKNDFAAYVALGAILAWAETDLLNDADLETWSRDLKPYLDPLAGLGGAGITTTTGGTGRLVIIVK
jgi:hypothetical protein